MTTTELARELGEKPKAILDAIRRGDLKAAKINDPEVVNGYRWDVTTPLEDARSIMANRVRRASRGTYPKVIQKRRDRMASAPLPTAKDLFRPEEAANFAGVNVSSYYKFIKENNITPLRNGRSSYVPREVVERFREAFRKSEPAAAVEAPRVLTATATKPDPRIDRIEKEVAAVFGLLRRFAKSCGYVEE